MHNDQASPLEQMIFAARACPDPSAELRRQTLAKSIRTYHERAQKRRMLIAASLLLGVIWVAGSARQLLAQTGREICGPDCLSKLGDLSLVGEKAALENSPFAGTDEWQAVERSLQSRSRRYQLLKSAFGATRTSQPSESSAPVLQESI